jgi:hypothetical protein
VFYKTQIGSTCLAHQLLGEHYNVLVSAGKLSKDEIFFAMKYLDFNIYRELSI